MSFNEKQNTLELYIIILGLFLESIHSLQFELNLGLQDSGKWIVLATYQILAWLIDFWTRRYESFSDDIIQNNAGSTINHVGWFNYTNRMVSPCFEVVNIKFAVQCVVFNLSCKKKPQLYPVYSVEEESKNWNYG